MEERLDKIIMARNLVSTRSRAEQIIASSGVLVNGKLVNKPGKKFPIDAVIELLEEEIPWVSQSALKLKKAFEHWNIDVKDKIAMDIGVSTGGFTEVLLQLGAGKVYAVDMASNKLHPEIKKDKRVIYLEKTNVRELNSNIISDPIDLCVIDVALLSLEKIFPFIHSFLKKDALLVALVKPQFEVSKDNLSKSGLVKRKAIYPMVLETVKQVASLNNLISQDYIESPILGNDGNREFLMLLKRN